MSIEITAITTCGTYPCWVDYTIASFYNHVDSIIVVNSGYNIQNVEDGPFHRLEREHELIQKIDIDHKILEYTPTPENIEEIKNLFSKEVDEFGRTSNLTLATQLAFNNAYLNSKEINKGKWILKLDADQILYRITREQLEQLIKEFPYCTGFRFAQHADYIHDFEHIGSLPDEFTNDGSLFYKSLPEQRYGGQGSPDTHVDQYRIYPIRTAHMRRICPPGVEPYEYHFKRLWYHSYGPYTIKQYYEPVDLTKNHFIEHAHEQAVSILRGKGNKISEQQQDERIPQEPPLICQMTPLEYIKKGY